MNHEKLRCYQLLAAVAEEIARRVSSWPRGNGYLIDQLSRAIVSSVLNLSEGNGKSKLGRERQRFFRISLGSIAEASACLNLACAFGLMQRQHEQSLKSKLRTAYKMIQALP